MERQREGVLLTIQKLAEASSGLMDTCPELSPFVAPAFIGIVAGYLTPLDVVQGCAK